MYNYYTYLKKRNIEEKEKEEREKDKKRKKYLESN